MEDLMKQNVRSLVYGAAAMAMAFVLSYIKLFSMPAGGSVTLCSMLPLLIYAHMFGWKKGLLCSLAYGLLQFIQKPEIYHWAQILLDYPLAFLCLGLAGCTKNLQLGSVLAVFGRFVCHTISGAVFFGDFTTLSGWWASALYNGGYLLVELILCLVLSYPVMLLMKKLPSGK